MNWFHSVTLDDRNTITGKPVDSHQKEIVSEGYIVSPPQRWMSSAVTDTGAPRPLIAPPIDKDPSKGAVSILPL